MIPRSLHGRFLALQSATLLLAAIAVPLVLALVLHRTADGLVAASLKHEALDLTQRLELSGGSPTISRTAGRGFALFDAASGAVLAGGGLPVRRIAFAHLSTDGKFARAGNRDVFARRIAWHGRPADLLVEQDRRSPDVIVDDVVAQVSWRIAWAVGAIMLVSLVVNRAILSRMLARSRRAVREARAIGPRRIRQRIDPTGLPSEMLALVDAVNDAVDRLARALAAQRDFAGHVSHEVKTPLAILMLRLGQIDDEELRASMAVTIARMDHVVEQLAALASVDGALQDFTGIELAPVVREVVEQRAILALEAGQAIAFEDRGDTGLIGHPGLLATVAENLIGNAIRHNPAGTRIAVAVGPGPRFEVVDDGAGPGAVQGNEFSRRGDGGGLGLVIARRICEVHGGSLSIAAIAAGGTRALASFDPA